MDESVETLHLKQMMHLIGSNGSKEKKSRTILTVPHMTWFYSIIYRMISYDIGLVRE